MDDLIDLGIILGVIVLSGVILVGTCVVLGGVVSRASCKAEWAQSKFVSSYSLMGGCLISEDGKTFMPEDAFKSVEIRK